jgi:hypothetical protein
MSANGGARLSLGAIVRLVARPAVTGAVVGAVRTPLNGPCSILWDHQMVLAIPRNWISPIEVRHNKKLLLRRNE